MSLDKMLSGIVKWFMPLLILGVIQLTGCGTTGSQKEEVSGALKLTEAVKVNREQYEKLSPQAKNDFDRALVAIQKDDNKLAEGLLKKIVKASPAFLSASVNLGILYYKSGQIPQAEGILKGVVKADSTNIVAFNYLGIVYRQQGKFNEAESAYKNKKKYCSDVLGLYNNEEKTIYINESVDLNKKTGKGIILQAIENRSSAGST